MRTVFDSGNDGLASNNQAVFALRVDCIAGNSSSINASESLGKTLPGAIPSTDLIPLVCNPNPTPINQSSKVGNDESTTSPQLPAGCSESARPHTLSRESLRLVTYVTELETTTVILKDKNDMYAPDKSFTVTGPGTP